MRHFKLFLLVVMITINASLLFGQSYAPSGPSSGLCPGVTYTYTSINSTPPCNNSGWSCAGCTDASGVSRSTPISDGMNPDGSVWAKIIWGNQTQGILGNECGSLTVSINSIAQPTITPSTQLLCGSGSIVLQAAVSSQINISSYVWLIVGSGVSPTGSVTTATPQLTLNYSNWNPISGLSATVAVGSKSSCGYNTPLTPLDNSLPGIPPIPRSAWVQLSPNPSGPGNVVSVASSGSNYEICSGESITLTATPPSGVSTNYGFDWYANYTNGGSGVLINGSSSSNASPVHTSGNTVTVSAPSGYGRFSISSRLNGNGCFSPQYTNSVSKRAGVYNSSEFSVVGPTSLCQNSTASYSPSYTASDITYYKWTWANSFNYQGGQGTSFLGVATKNPFYGGAITLQLQNRCGYTGSPSVLSIGGRMCAGVLATASPNPASTTLQINLTPQTTGSPASQLSSSSVQSLQSPVTGVLVNESNVELWSGTIQNNSHSIDISTFPNGTYYMKLNIDGEISTQRIVIRH